MRDDGHSRKFQPNEPFRRPTAGAGNAQGGDPLAELARLIGQNDPFSDFARDQGHVPAPAYDPRRAEPAPSDWQAQPTSYRDAPQYSQPAPDAYRAPSEQHDYAPPHRDDATDADPRYAPQGPGHAPQGHASQGHAPQGHAHQGYAPEGFAPQGYSQPGPAAGQERDPQYRDPQYYQDPRYATAGYGDQQQGYPPQNSFPPMQGQPAPGFDPRYRGMPHDEDMYEERSAPRGRRGLLTVMAVLALAVVGTAAAFGYRAVFSSAGSTLTPPTIRADAGPNKVVPTAQTSDASGKLIYDRVGDKSQPERMVSREEQPVDLKNAVPPPRVVLSSGMANPIAPVPTSPVPPSAPAFAAPSAAASAATAASASTEPKKVRTLTIRPDQPAAAPETAIARPAAMPASARSAIGEDQPIPANTTVRTTTIRTQPVSQPVQSSDPNAPLSLTPNSSAQRAGAMRTASAPASRPVATAAGDSAYAVQVTSQRTEAEAQSSFRALQAKYPAELGTRQAAIRRADLGDKGTYYRAQVPFGSQSEASEFCAGLKAAGGQCVVQRN